MLLIQIPKSPWAFPIVVAVVSAGAIWAAIKITLTAFISVIPVVYYTLKEIYREDAK